MSNEENTLKFVRSDGSESDGELLQKAFDKAKSADFHVQVLSATELLKQDLGNDKSLFVLDVFSGKCFEFLLAKKKRIFGPICIMQCLEKMIPAPNVYHPVYSLAMHGVAVSCTSISKPVRERVYQLVERMGGITLKDFTSAVTHLVTKEVGSKKYAIACDLNKVIVLPSWVEESWEKTQRCNFDAKDSSFVAVHLCPIFKGCMICVSGVQADRRKEIQSAVEEHGGEYSAELRMNSTTHLLVEKPMGQKYEFASRWNKPCVHPKWLFDCIEAGHWLSESSYTVKDERDLDKTGSTTSRLSITTVNATMNNTTTGASRKAAEAAQKSAEAHGQKHIFNESRKSSTANPSSKQTVKPAHDEDEWDYKSPMPSGEMFLDGCKIYLSGFVGRKLEHLQKIINAGGATRFNQLNASVSHVVMGEKLENEIEKLGKSEFPPHIVTAKWLLDCCHQVKCLPEQDYYCLETNDVFHDIIVRPVDESKKSKEQQVDKATTNKENLVANDDVLSHYLDLMNDDLPAMIEPEPNAGLKTDKKSLPEVNKPEREADIVVPVDDNSPSEEPEELFHGLTFQIKGFSKETETQLKNVIESKSGVVLKETSTKLADYLVLPMDYECDDDKAVSLVTYCWLERSLECRQLLDPGSNFLFTPFSLAKNTFPLKDCVISISQYVGVERDHLIQLVKMLGAHYQEFFSRTTRTDLLGNTHLLLQEPTGSKYNAAIHWNIPAVSTNWLFECACSGTQLAEEPFRIDKEQSEGEEEEEIETVGEKTATSEEFRVPERSGSKSELERANVPELEETKDEIKAPLDKAKDAASTEVSMPTSAHPVINKPPAYFGRPKRPSFDLTDAIEVLQSPYCSSGSGSSSAHSRLSRSSRSSFLLDDYIQEHMQAALKNTGCQLGPRVDGLEQASVNKTDLKENKDQEPQSFLCGVILHVSKKLTKQQIDIHNMASAVGADCRWSLDDSCTHVIHEGRITKEQSQAKSKGVHVVSPHWVYSCIEEQRLVDESLYPSTLNPKLTLPVVKTRRSARSSTEVKVDCHKNVSKPEETGVDTEKTKDTSIESKPYQEADIEPAAEIKIEPEPATKFEMDDLKKSEVEANNMLSQDSAQSDSLRTKEEIRQIQGIMEAMKSSRRRSRRLNSSNSGSNSRSSSGNSNGASSRKLARRQSSRLRSLRSGQNDSEDERDKQPMDTITYDDPSSRIERERIIAQLAKCSPTPASESEHNDDNDETIDEKQVKCKSEPSTTEDERNPTIVVKTEAPSPSSPTPTPDAPPIALHIATTSRMPEPVSLLDPAVELENIRPQQTRKFLLSGMSQQEKIDYGALIEELGGELFDNKYFNPVCCHIIVGQINRNEKCLASIAAGIWVLHKSYLEASRLAGHFVDEEDHEWGVEIPGVPLSNLACAARKWRMELRKKSQRHNAQVGAFQNWKILLCVEEGKASSFARLLEAGGAKVVGTKPPFHDITGVTHAFISPGKSSLVQSIDFERLQKAKILVLKTEYIADYLTENPLPSVGKYLIKKSQERLKLANRKRKPDESTSETTEKRFKRS